MNGVNVQAQDDRSGFPVAAEALPKEKVSSGKYALTFVKSSEQLRAVQRLRFEVFNLELGEGLRESFATGLDVDDLDAVLHHLLILNARSGEAVGTYRMQTWAMASANLGFYTAREFDLSRFPAEVLEDAVEVGRACIAKEHRSRRVLHLLWKGLACYLTSTDKHYIFGCCSLTSQDRRIGNQVYAQLVDDGFLHPTLRAWPEPGFECDWVTGSEGVSGTPTGDNDAGGAGDGDTGDVDGGGATATDDEIAGGAGGGRAGDATIGVAGGSRVATDHPGAGARTDVTAGTADGPSRSGVDASHSPHDPYKIPPLFDSYLKLGAKICGPPAIDREFGTIDFLVILNIRKLERHVYRSFFG